MIPFIQNKINRNLKYIILFFNFNTIEFKSFEARALR